MDLSLRQLKDLLVDLWSEPDASLLDAGGAAELLIARIRLGLTSALLLLPILNLLLGLPEERRTHFVGLAVTLVAVGVAGLAYWLVQREFREAWLPFFTSLMDVSLVTMALLAFTLTGFPHQAVNSKVAFEVYFLAIGATCLRYDLRLSILAGAAAVLEYGLVIFIVTHFYDLDSIKYAPWVYGRFYASEQVSRLILLMLQSTLCAVIVYRLQRHRRLSNSDRLTGLFNRAYFEEFLAAEIRRSKRYSRTFAVAMVDIDKFKVFNDTYGHPAGDQALKLVSSTLQRSVRRSDLVARYGGEEMVMVMPETNLSAARRRMEGIREAVAETPIELAKRTDRVRVTVSAGVATWPVDGQLADDLLHTADARLFHAKALGRNRVVSSSEAAASV